MEDAVDTDCCLCLVVLTEPVVTQCGHTSDRRCLVNVLPNAEGDLLCPKCRTKLHSTALAVCRPLQQLIAASRPEAVATRLEELGKLRTLASSVVEGKVDGVRQLLTIRGVHVSLLADDGDVPPLLLAIRHGRLQIAALHASRGGGFGRHGLAGALRDKTW